MVNIFGHLSLITLLCRYNRKEPKMICKELAWQYSNNFIYRNSDGLDLSLAQMSNLNSGRTLELLGKLFRDILAGPYFKTI